MVSCSPVYHHEKNNLTDNIGLKYVKIWNQFSDVFPIVFSVVSRASYLYHFSFSTAFLEAAVALRPGVHVAHLILARMQDGSIFVTAK